MCLAIWNLIDKRSKRLADDADLALKEILRRLCKDYIFDGVCCSLVRAEDRHGFCCGNPGFDTEDKCASNFASSRQSWDDCDIGFDYMEGVDVFYRQRIPCGGGAVG